MIVNLMAPEVYLGLCQTSVMVFFTEIFNGWSWELFLQKRADLDKQLRLENSLVKLVSVIAIN